MSSGLAVPVAVFRQTSVSLIFKFLVDNAVTLILCINSVRLVYKNDKQITMLGVEEYGVTQCNM
jgi:hypothetical protein